MTAEAPTRSTGRPSRCRTSSATTSTTRWPGRGNVDRHPRGVPRRGPGTSRCRVLRAVRRRDGGDGPQPQHPRAGGHRLPEAPGSAASPAATSTASATCTRGPSCSSRAAGWVRFEPTPSDRAGRGPGYTSIEFPATGRDRPAEQRGRRGRREPTHSRSPTPRSRTPRTRPARMPAASSFPWRTIVIGVLGLVACWSGWRCCRGWSGAAVASVGWSTAPSPSGSSCATPWSTSASPGRPVAHRARPARYLVHYFGRPVGDRHRRRGPATGPTSHPRPRPRCSGSSPRSSSSATPAPAATRSPSSRPTPRRSSARSRVAFSPGPGVAPSGCPGRCSSPVVARAAPTTPRPGRDDLHGVVDHVGLSRRRFPRSAGESELVGARLATPSSGNARQVALDADAQHTTKPGVCSPGSVSRAV